jgi:flavodoxin
VHLPPTEEHAMSTLVVYYSRSGHTEQVAREIAERCGADLEAIVEREPRVGRWSYMGAAWQALMESEPAIRAPAKDPAAYDTVVIGTPVWVQRPAPAVRSYLHQYGPRLKRVAFFCTEGGAGERKAFGRLRQLCGRDAVATLAVTEKQLPPEKHAEQLSRFTTALAA